MVSHDVAAAERYATHILQLGHSQLYFGTVAGYRGSAAERRLRGGGCK
jgi:zinc transport system ATP-binding protein